MAINKKDILNSLYGAILAIIKAIIKLNTPMYLCISFIDMNDFTGLGFA